MYKARIDRGTRRIRVQRSLYVLKSACPRILYYIIIYLKNVPRVYGFFFFLLMLYSYKCFSRTYTLLLLLLCTYNKLRYTRRNAVYYGILCTIAIYGIVKNRLEEKSIA